MNKHILGAAGIGVALGGCDGPKRPTGDPAEPATAAEARREHPHWIALRTAMVDQQIEARGVRDERVLAAMRRVPRHAFVPDPTDDAYGDFPLRIGHDQTISQPYIVAIMTELAAIAPGERVLEIGTGSGYQAAVLCELAGEVYSIEIVEPLGRNAAAILERLGYRPHLRIGDGYQGWPEAAPFDAILVTAAPPAIPAPLLEQLAVGGRLVIPVGDAEQDLRVITRTAAGHTEERLFPVAFVPMTGAAQDRPARR